jgi:predicted ribonuclease YlaK
VIDTNILLTLLEEVTRLVDSLRWTVIIPLAVITELDGLSANSGELGIAALAAVDFISSRIRSHSISLKVQTSKGNYLSALKVRVEDVQFKADDNSWERSMDDLIVRAAVWQTDHWVDRSKLLSGVRSQSIPENAAKVLLLTLDRNRK